MTLKALTAVVLGLGLLCAPGCGGKKDAPKGDGKKEGDDHEHGDGPHGGVILELGKYHGEFKPDHAKKEATVWLLKGDAKTPARLKVDKVRLVVSNTNPKIEIDLLPTDADADGTASTFVGKHDGFGVEMEYEGTVSVTIDGKPYSDDFKEAPEKK
jgi:hypothetical protein